MEIAAHDLSTVEGVRAAVAQIADEAGDNETAHADEDTLHVGVLAVIAAGMGDARVLATEALATVNLDFTRWYA